nr:hypothetical protein B0A51_03709 [Rachicladosporium sp. CCFEE 5018]
MDMEIDPTNAPAPKKASRICRHNYDKWWSISSKDRVRCITFVDGLIESDRRTEFQSSFINYCYRQISRLDKADTTWSKFSSKETAEYVLAVMSKEPTDFEEFKTLLTKYEAGSWRSGPTKGLAPIVAPIDKAKVRNAQQELHTLIYSKRHRDIEDTTSLSLTTQQRGSDPATRRQGKMQLRLARKREDFAVEQAAEELEGLNMDSEDVQDVKQAAEELEDLRIKKKRSRKHGKGGDEMQT